MNCFFAHKWEKWSEPVQVELNKEIISAQDFSTHVSRVTKLAQRRDCTRCGIVDVRYIDKPLPDALLKPDGGAA